MFQIHQQMTSVPIPFQWLRRRFFSFKYINFHYCYIVEEYIDLNKKYKQTKKNKNLLVSNFFSWFWSETVLMSPLNSIWAIIYKGDYDGQLMWSALYFVLLKRAEMNEWMYVSRQLTWINCFRENSFYSLDLFVQLLKN